jgi:2Fe-2S ferredoxin
MGRKNNGSILFLPSQMSCPIGSEQSVLEVALRNGLEIPHSCGGMGSCTTCRVEIESALDALAPRNELEADIAEMRNFSPRERLSCQLQPQDGLIVTVPQGLEEPDLA